jgi:hypothetical protein
MGTYEFMLEPPLINENNTDKKYIYLKSFSSMNTLHNVLEQSFTITKIYNQTEYDYPRTFKKKCYSVIEELIYDLNIKSSSIDGSDYITNKKDEDYLDGMTSVPKLTFVYDKKTNKILTKYENIEGVPVFFRLTGQIFDLLNIPSTILSENSILSEKPINLFRSLHNINITCNQISTTHNRSENNIPNRLMKLVLKRNYGEYIQMTAKHPITKYELNSQSVNKLSFKLYSDDAEIWEPDRFFLSIVIESHKPIIHHSNYWIENPETTLIRESETFRNPPFLQNRDNTNCPM